MKVLHISRDMPRKTILVRIVLRWPVFCISTASEVLLLLGSHWLAYSFVLRKDSFFAR